MIKNKRGWIKIIEAFTAIMIIMSVLMIVVDRGYTGKKDISSNIYEIELTILESVAMNDILKDEILNSNPDGNANFITDGAREKIEEGIPNYLLCTPRICSITWTNCVMMDPYNRETYAQSIIITDIENEENSKRLKLFCAVK